MSNRKIIRLRQLRAQRAAAAKVQFVDVWFENATGVEERVTFPTQDDWPVRLVEEVEGKDGNANIAVLRQIANPPDAFDRLVREAGLTLGELTQILTEMGEEAGTTAGEGDGSSNSSGGIPEPSEPTSSGTTPDAA